MYGPRRPMAVRNSHVRNSWAVWPSHELPETNISFSYPKMVGWKMILSKLGAKRPYFHGLSEFQGGIGRIYCTACMVDFYFKYMSTKLQVPFSTCSFLDLPTFLWLHYYIILTGRPCCGKCWSIIPIEHHPARHELYIGKHSSYHHGTNNWIRGGTLFCCEIQQECAQVHPLVWNVNPSYRMICKSA